MLQALRFQNLGLFDQTGLRFGPGLSVLTGESGAGKSLVLEGLALLAGSARPRLRPRAGKESGFVEAEFDIGGQTNLPLRRRLEEEGLLDEEMLVLARRVQESGRTRAFAQGQQISRSLLEEIGTHLFEFCDQGQSHGLRAPAAQLQALDGFLGLLDERKKTARLFAKLTQLSSQCDELLARRAENERRLEFVEYQLEEIDQCAFEDYSARATALEEQTRLSVFADVLRTCCAEVDGDAQSALGRLRFVQKNLETADWPTPAGTQDEVCAEVGELLGRLDQLSDTLRATWDGLARATTEERKHLEEDVNRVRRVAQKHRISPEELGDKRRELSATRSALEAEAKHLSVLERERSRILREAEKAAQRLHDSRVSGAGRFDRTVTAEVQRLGLRNATLETHLACGDLGPTGTSQISIGFSANPGMEALPLGRVASGGELARVLLSMRLALGPRAPLLCFDEIDAGAGGAIASSIGEALRRASAGGQVLCVSHWPQVASLADTHLRVIKDSSASISRLEMLPEKDRVEELTRMLGGNQRTAQRHAERLRRPAA